MDEFGIPRLKGIGSAIRKRRSRRPRPESQPASDGRDISSLSSTPPSDDVMAGSSEENSGGNDRSRRKELSLSQCASRFPGAGGQETEKAAKRNKKIDVGIDELYDNTGSRDSTDQGRSGSNNKRSSEGALAPANWKNTSKEPQKTMALNRKPEEAAGPSVDAPVTENKVKVKLKLRGVTRTIDGNTSTKASVTSDATVSRQKSSHKEGLAGFGGNSDAGNSPSNDKRVGLQGIPWKDFSRVGFSLVREESSTAKGARKDSSVKQREKTDSTRKSKRAPKKRAVDDDDNDDEIRYLEKLKNARLSTGLGDEDEESNKKHRKLSKFSGNSPQDMEGSSSSRSGKDGKKSSPSAETDYEQEEEFVSDGEPESRRKKIARREPVDSLVESKLTLTTRQRALQSGRDASVSGGSVVEFPNGLPPPPSKKQKEQLTEVEQQLKKVEAAQRRKMQNEKAARECEAEAIRKILGQDSSRKKREGRNKKRAEELAQEKEADAIRASNTVRLVMGPNGTTVTFPNEMGLPSIFTSKPRSYPPPREKCAGPSCTNPYKYRDSKTKLPLCSLQCYKAVQGNVQSEAAAY